MTLRTLSYQQRVLDLLDSYLDEISRQRTKVCKIKKANEKQTDSDLWHEEIDFVEKTWEGMRGKLPASRLEIEFSPRTDGTGQPVPNIVYKIPTGGGKTFLAVSSIPKIFSKYLGKQTGFVLWIVPNEAIYAQTKQQLTDRQHPYRQMLNNLAGAPKDVKIMEKTTPFSAQDVKESLCVMILMLQSSNRQNQETLKIFRERGDVYGFVPKEDDQQAHTKMKEAISNLDLYDLAGAPAPWLPIKESLGNALRIIRPVVIMDEGHKAVSDLAFKTLYDFNPSFVLELTATPKDVPARNRYQNILAEVSGTEIDREGMLKMPINLDAQQNTDWQSTLKAGLNELDNLAAIAKKFQANHSRYIRPIMLVQVERTGRDQRDGKKIHSQDVREWLMVNGGLQDSQIAIKTSQQNDLKNPENQDSLSEENPVRVIITKQALQEGWDCPFAYVLCALAASQARSAMTQIMGRILRQPHAEKTGIPELDQCYVITHHAETGEVVKAVKDGLEKEGMQDLQGIVRPISSEGENHAARKIPRRKEFMTLPIFLPKVLRTTKEEARELDYETDILYPLDWRDLNLSKFVKSIPEDYTAAERQLYQISVDASLEEKEALAFLDSRIFDSVRIIRYICDIVQNPWIAYDIVDGVRLRLMERGFSDQKLGKFSSFIEEELRKWLIKQRDQKAEKRFIEEVKAHRIQFRLRTDGKNWQMPQTIEAAHPEKTPHLMHHDGAVRKSLFTEIHEPDFNQSEKNIALYLDGAKTMHWWHRNAARHHYHIQGWKRDKIYPDFICSVRKNSGNGKIVVLETKGDFLGGNEDTKYKRKMLELMKKCYAMEKNVTPVGKMEVLIKDNICIECEMVMIDEYEAKLPTILGS